MIANLTSDRVASNGRRVGRFGDAWQSANRRSQEICRTVQSAKAHSPDSSDDARYPTGREEFVYLSVRSGRTEPEKAQTSIQSCSKGRNGKTKVQLI